MYLLIEYGSIPTFLLSLQYSLNCDLTVQHLVDKVILLIRGVKFDHILGSLGSFLRPPHVNRERSLIPLKICSLCTAAPPLSDFF